MPKDPTKTITISTECFLKKNTSLHFRKVSNPIPCVFMFETEQLSSTYTTSIIPVALSQAKLSKVKLPTGTECV